MSLLPPVPWLGRPTAKLNPLTDRQILHIFSFVGWLEDREGGRDGLPGFPWDGRGGEEGPESPISLGRGLGDPSELGWWISTRESPVPTSRGEGGGAELGSASHEQHCNFLNSSFSL